MIGKSTICVSFQDSEMEESSNLNAPPTPSTSDVDDGEEVVSPEPCLHQHV